jgi:hypothetical protein
MARFGYAAKGLVYVVIGFIAVNAAFSTDQATGGSGALQEIMDETYGTILMAFVAVGLVGYVVWKLTQAFADPEHEGKDKEGAGKRVRYAVSALIYAGLAIQAFALVIGSGGGGGGGGNASGWTAKVMEQPFGRWAVGIFGVIVFCAGFYEFYAAYKDRFMKKLATSRMSATMERGVRIFGRAGRAARGVVFLVMGGFLVLAAVNYNPQEARGLGGALRTMEDQPYGPYLLAAVGAGLFAYGVFQFVKARYRRIPA